MATLIFDIETVGESWDSFDSTTKASLMRWVDRISTDEKEHNLLTKDVCQNLGFSPFTSMIVAIGLYDVERQQGVVYYTGNGDEIDEEEGDFILKSRSEKEMLKDFWDGALNYDTFVTFNGRGFDVPFINIRTAIHDMRPTHDLMEGRYLSQQRDVRHVDLQDQLSYYGAMHRKPSLHLACRAFKIESPKEAGVSGDDVAELFRMKKFRDIARYNARDVIATTALYKKWLDHLAPYNFLNTLE